MQWPRELGKAPTKKPEAVKLPDGEWAIAVETDWPDRARYFWTGDSGRPWCPNMGKALVFEAFRGADMELSTMTTSSAQVISRLVEAGHEDLADSLCNLVTSKSLHIAVRDLPGELQKALKQVGFRKQDIEVIAAEKYTMFGAGSSGRKDFTMAVNLKTGQTQLEEGSWGGANPFVKNPVDLDDKPRRLPPDFAVIKGSRGSGPTWARILVHPNNLANLLPVKEDDSMPKEELAALAIISGIKGGQYRRDEFSRYRELGEYGPNNAHIKSLLNKGMVKIAKNGGISITTKGKNVNPGYQKLYSIMKANTDEATAAPAMDPARLDTDHEDFWALLKTIEQSLNKYPEVANEALFGLDRALEQAEKDLRDLHKFSGKMQKRLRKALQQ